LVFQLSPQAAITKFGLASTAPCRGAPKIAKMKKLQKKKKRKFEMALVLSGFESVAHASR
jgi:hypothetical protein